MDSCATSTALHAVTIAFEGGIITALGVLIIMLKRFASTNGAKQPPEEPEK